MCDVNYSIPIQYLIFDEIIYEMQEKYDCKRRMKEFSIDVVSSYVLILRTILYCFLCVKSSFKASLKGVAKIEVSKNMKRNIN